MTTAIKTFTHPSFGDIRTAGTAEAPLFCLVDVCKVLDIKNPSRAKKSLKSGGVHLMKVTTLQKNQYARKGYAKNRTHSYHDGAGDVHTHTYLVWTESGRQFLHEFISFHASMNDYQ